MSTNIQVIIGVLMPFLGTTLGSSFVYFMKNEINLKFEKILLGIASGVMIAASIWSLIIPAIEMNENSKILAWFPATFGFLLGVGLFILLDKLNDILDFKGKKLKMKNKKTLMMIIAVTIHNIPEGMAVGVILAGAMIGNASVSMASALALSLGVAIQNFPEGAIISMPLKTSGMSKSKAFFYGVLSGLVEPIGAGITIILTNLVVPILPYLLSFAAGAMIYVVVDSLIPEIHEGKFSKLGIFFIAIGFSIMMVLDVSLG